MNLTELPAAGRLLWRATQCLAAVAMALLGTACATPPEHAVALYRTPADAIAVAYAQGFGAVPLRFASSRHVEVLSTQRVEPMYRYCLVLDKISGTQGWIAGSSCGMGGQHGIPFTTIDQGEHHESH